MRTGTSTRGTPILLSVVITLLIAGCGGAGGANPDPGATDLTTTEPRATDLSDVDQPADTGAGVPPDHGGTGATITVGSETWEFELTDLYPGGCYLHQDGLRSAGAVDGDFLTGVNFTATDLTPDGGRIEVKNYATGEEWMAAADRATMTTFHLLPDGVSQIDTITIDGARIWGTATFIEKTAAGDAIVTNSSLPASVTGSFDIQCSG